MTDCSGCGCSIDPEFSVDPRRRRILGIVLAINTLMFGFELAVGLWASSTALQADSLDMLADSLVYALSLFVLTRSPQARAFAGLSNGILELVLALAVLAQIADHAFTSITPVGAVIMVVAAIAFGANFACGALLIQLRHEDINMRAVWLCTRNDALGNAGTILAGSLVVLFGSKWPDLVIATVIATVLIHTAAGVIREAAPQLIRPSGSRSTDSTGESAP